MKLTTCTKRLFRFAAVSLLLTVPALAQMEPPDFQITPAERTVVIEGSIAKLNEIYVFPDTAAKMEKAVRARLAKGEYAGITSAKELARKLTDDFREVSKDKHLHMMYFADGAKEMPAGGPTLEQMESRREYMEKVNFGFEKFERMQGNIGLVEIRGFVPPQMGGEAASAMMTLAANTDALIIDLRRNGGGEPAMIAHVLSYLFDEPTHLNDIYERLGDKTQQWWTSSHVPGRKYGGTKPVYVLTSSNTFSGGEEFAYNLKNLNRAKLIGETTGGGAHPVRPVKVSEHFMIGVPFARAISPITKTNWEGTGVTPHIEKAAAETLDTAYLMAIERVAETTTNPQQKAQLQRLIEEKKKQKS